MIRVGIRCDAGTRIGVGHLMRCVALAEELVRRGAQVQFLGDLGLPWARQQLTDRALPWQPAPDDPAALARTAERLGLDAVVLDSYELPTGTGASLRYAGRTVLAIVDGDLRGQDADLYVDQNLDADLLTPALPPGAVRLAGLRYALLRSAVRHLRPAGPRAPDPRRTPTVVCFFGGTDAYRAAPTVVPLLLDTGAPFAATVVAADAGLRAELLDLRPGAGQRIDMIAPTDRLPTLLSTADLAISASGTSTWELLCLGLPAALVWVVDNQQAGYTRTVLHGLAAGLGHLPALADNAEDDASASQYGQSDAAAVRGGPPGARSRQQAVEVLRTLLTDRPTRAGLSARGWSAVDGRGTERVAAELLSRCRPII